MDYAKVKKAARKLLEKKGHEIIVSDFNGKVTDIVSLVNGQFNFNMVIANEYSMPDEPIIDDKFRNLYEKDMRRFFISPDANPKYFDSMIIFNILSFEVMEDRAIVREHWNVGMREND